MYFTDLFIRRPVVSLSLGILILLSGLWAMAQLPLGLYPKITFPVIHVMTSYPGASPEVVQNYVTDKIQTSLNGIDGVDYITSTSSQGSSEIGLHFFLGENLDQAISAVMRNVQSVTSELPTGTLTPTIESGHGQMPYLILRATSHHPSLEWVTDYLDRMVVPELQLVTGISDVAIWGPRYTMDIRLNPQKMIARNLSAQDVVSAILHYTTPSAPGNTYGESVSYALNPETTLHTPDDFQNLIIKNDATNAIHLKDIGNATFHDNDENNRAWFDGMRGDGIGLTMNPNANPLTVADAIHAILPKIQSHLPDNIQLGEVFNITKYIHASLHEVMKSIIEAMIIVVGVMLLLLGSPRTVAVPLSAIPLSLIGVCFIMWLCHFSFNTLTLLAMVLAIGLVVDDAIVVVENIVRHIETGKTAMQAALIGAREMTGPVIAMTLTLAAVYTPMLLASGVTGHLFTEFAMTLAGSVLISGIIALTLSPLFCAHFLSQNALTHRWVLAAEKRVTYLRSIYLNKLNQILQHRGKVMLAWFFILLGCAYLYQKTPHELVPREDTGILMLAANAPADANLNYLEKYRPAVEAILKNQKDVTNYVEVLNNNALMAYVSLRDWRQRTLSGQQLIANMQEKLNKIAGFSTFVQNISLVPGAGGNNTVSLMLTGNMDYASLYRSAKKLEQLAQQSGHFLYVQDSLQYNQPQINLKIDKTAATAMHISPDSIANQLTSLLSQRRITQFSWEGHSYDIEISIPQKYRRNPEDILNLQVPNEKGTLIPLNSVLRMHLDVMPQALNQFQKRNSVSIMAQTAPGTSYSEGLTVLQHIAETKLDKNIMLDYSGMTRQFLQEGQHTLWIFGLAIVIIFLVLSIQFNRFRDALIILLGSVPLALFSALLPLWLGFGTVNIYTQIGLLTLIGLISKHGILLTEFANHAQRTETMSPLEAILQSARLRFRPIIMTTAAMVVGAFPLLFAEGAGAESRHAIGIIIVSGMSLGTLFTLFVMPVLYLWFGRKQHATSPASWM